MVTPIILLHCVLVIDTMFIGVISLSSTSNALLWHDAVTIYLSSVGLWTAIILAVLSLLDVNQVHCRNMDRYSSTEQQYVDSACSLQANGTWIPYVVTINFVVLGAILLVWKSLGINLVARKTASLSHGTELDKVLIKWHKRRCLWWCYMVLRVLMVLTAALSWGFVLSSVEKLSESFECAIGEQTTPCVYASAPVYKAIGKFDVVLLSFIFLLCVWSIIKMVLPRPTTQIREHDEVIKIDDSIWEDIRHAWMVPKTIWDKAMQWRQRKDKGVQTGPRLIPDDRDLILLMLSIVNPTLYASFWEQQMTSKGSQCESGSESSLPQITTTVETEP